MRYLVILLVLISSVVCADPGVQTDKNIGFIDVATPSFDVGPTVQVNVGALLPYNTKGFTLYSYGGPVVLGPTTDLASGTVPTGLVIASGSYITWSGLDVTTTKNIYAISNSTATATCKLLCW